MIQSSWPTTSAKLRSSTAGFTHTCRLLTGVTGLGVIELLLIPGVRLPFIGNATARGRLSALLKSEVTSSGDTPTFHGNVCLLID